MDGKTVHLLGDRKLRGRGRGQLESLKARPSNSLTQTSLHFLKFPKPPKMYPALGNQAYERFVEDISRSTYNRR